jgi:hypothetical protein
MQLNSVYLYPNKIDVFTNTSAAWPTERYRKVYNRNLKIYRSVDNKIDLQVRNSSQKSTAITGTVLVFNLVTVDTKDLILSKDCVTQSNENGRVYVVLTKEELLDLESGFYNFTVTQESRTFINANEYTVSSRTPLYIDDQYGVIATIEVLGDVFGEAVDSLVVDKFSYVNPFTSGGTSLDQKYYISSIIDTSPQYGPVPSLSTFVIYMTNYSGVIQIQASIEPQGATPSVWTTVETLTLTNATLEIQNVIGKYNWFRIKHLPTISSTGTVDKVLYR